MESNRVLTELIAVDTIDLSDSGHQIHPIGSLLEIIDNNGAITCEMSIRGEAFSLSSLSADVI